MARDYGPLAFDIPHRLVASFIYELPFGAGRRFVNDGVAAAILGGWAVNGILTLSDGRPFTVTAMDTAGTGLGRISRANCVGDAVPDGFDQTLDAWFDVNAFAPTVGRTYGNCENNSVRGPGSKSMNMSLFRSIASAATSASSCASRPSTCSTGSTTASRPPTSATPAPSAGSPARWAIRGRCSWRSSSTSRRLGATGPGTGTGQNACHTVTWRASRSRSQGESLVRSRVFKCSSWPQSLSPRSLARVRPWRLRSSSACWPVAVVPSAQTIPQDSGAAGAWQKILKARTTASVMHTTAHPDDEHGGVHHAAGRRDGARLALMTLNRGESGDNAIGPQLFDGLGLIRTEELRVADRYYGVDEQYFTTVVDYGFSKRLEEAFEKWGTRERDARRGAGHPHQPAVGAAVALPGQRARRPRQPPDRRADHRAGVQAGRRSDDVSRADQGRAAAVAAVQGLHRRRPRERGLDRAHRQRRVQPLARRLVRQRRPLRPQLPALAEQRPLQPRRRRAQLRLLLARRLAGGGRRRPRRRRSSTASTPATRACSRRWAAARPRAPPTSSRASTARSAGRRRLQLHRPVGAPCRGWPRRCSSSARPSPRAPARTRRCSCCASRSARPRTRSPRAWGSS